MSDRPGASLIIKLLVSDVDGTLVTRDKRLTERSREAVKGLGNAGIAFAITSSRPPLGLRMLIKPLNITTPIFGFNGGLIVTPSDLAVIERHPLPAEVVREAVAGLKGQGVDVWVFNRSQWLVLDIAGPYVDHEIKTLQHLPDMIENFDRPGIIDDAYKVVGVSADFDLLARVEVTLQGELSSMATVARSQNYYLDITHPEANKGEVVKLLAQRLGLPRSAIAVIGDGQNDLTMFAEAGLRIAMAGAVADLRRKADIVTDCNEEDGFAKAVERYVLRHEFVGKTERS